MGEQQDSSGAGPDGEPGELGAQHDHAISEAQGFWPDNSTTWLRQVNFRVRVSGLAAAAVGLAVAFAALVSYLAVSHQLEGQVTPGLNSAVAQAESRHLVHADFTGPGQYTVVPEQLLNFQDRTGTAVQVFTRTQVVSSKGVKPFFPLNNGAKDALQDPVDSSPAVGTMSAANGELYRVATITIAPGLVMQVGYPLVSLDNALAYLRLVLLLVAIAGVGIAAGLGWFVGRAAIRPVEDLTLAAEHVATTQDFFGDDRRRGPR